MTTTDRNAGAEASRPSSWMIVTLVLASMLAASAATATVIDDFTTAQAQISAPPPASSTINGAGILGSDRGMAIERLAGADLVSAEVVGGVLELADGNARARLVVIWDADTDPDAIDPVGLGGIDLTDGGDATGLRVVTTTLMAPVDLIVTVYTDADHVSTAARRLDSAGSVVFSLSEGFIATGSVGGADFTDVGAVVVELATSIVPPPPPPPAAPSTEPETVLPSVVIAVDLIDTVGPAIAATKDALDATGTVDVDPALPGQTLTYRIEVDNAGGTASNVQVSDTIDPNLTVVPDSLTTRPFAVDDLYQAVGNVQLSVAAVDGLLANDRDVDDGASPQPLTVTLFDATSAGGGTVSVAADGSFTFTSAAGFGGVDQFGYTATDNEGQTDTGTVTVTVADTVWFVENTVAAGGAGTFDDPFHALASAEAASEAGHTIRVRRGDGTDTNHDLGIDLKPRQKLIGAGVPLVVGGVELEPADPMGAPSVSHTDHVVDLADDVEVRGLVIDTNAASAEHAIRGSGVSGQIAISDVAIIGNGNHGGVLLGMSPSADVTLTDVDVVAGDEPALQVADVQSVTLAGSCDLSSAGTVMDIATTTLNGMLNSIAGAQARFDTLAAASSFAVATSTTLTNPSGTGLLVQNSPNVGLAFGATSVMDTAIGAGATATGIDLATGNGGATFSFASLAVVADGGAGLFTGAGTVDIASATSTLAATGGPAIDADGTTLQSNAASGWTFAGLTSTASPGFGLRLANTGDPVTVTGTTMLTGAAGRAIELSNAAATVFAGQLVAASTGGAGLFASNSGAVTVSMGTSTVSAVGGPAISMSSTGIGAGSMTFASVMAGATGASPGILFDNVDSGSFVSAGTTIAGTGAGQHGIHINGSAAGFAFNGATAVDDTGGDGIRLEGANGGVGFVTVAIDDTGGNGLTVSGNVATVDVLGGTIGETAGSATTTAGNAVDISGGTANVTVAAAIRNTANRSVEVTNRAAAIATVSGAINDTGTGINVANNTGGTTRFTNASKVIDTGGNQAVTLATNGGHRIEFTGGGLDVDTSGAAGFVATGGGTLQVAGTGNTVDTANAVGMEINGVTLATVGGGPPTERGAIFQRVAASGALHGIRLLNAGSGGLAVTGTGTTDGSGGVIQNITNRGIEVISTDHTAFTNMTLTNAAQTNGPGPCPDAISSGANTGCNAPVHLETSTGPVLDNVDITGSAQHGINGWRVTDFSLIDSTVLNAGNEVGENGAKLFNLFGTSRIDGTTIDNSFRDNVRIQNNDNTQLNLTVDNSAFTDSAGGHGFHLSGRSASRMNLVLEDSAMTGNGSSGTQLQGSDDVTASGGAFEFRVHRCGFANNAAAAIDMGAVGQSPVYFEIMDNGTGGGGAIVNHGSHVISVNQGGNSSAPLTTATIDGVISGNVIGTGPNNSGTTAGSGIRVVENQSGTMRVLIENNAVKGWTEHGIFVIARDAAAGAGSGSSDVDVTIRGNTVNDENGGFPIAGIAVQGGAANLPAEVHDICASIGEATQASEQNIVTVGGFPIASIRTRQRFNTTIDLFRGASASTDPATVLADNNAESPATASSGTVTVVATACDLPVSPP